MQVTLPEHLAFPLPAFEASYRATLADGAAVLANSRLAIVGLARNCAGPMRENLRRLDEITKHAAGWQLHVETNDNADDTLQVLEHFCRVNRQATFTAQTLGRKQFSTEFAGPRTIALAEYRAACQSWVRDCAEDSDYVVVIDWDQWGGFSAPGILAGLGWLLELQGAYGMASVSLTQVPALTSEPDGTSKRTAMWVHYDAWALRLNSYWDDYTAGHGGWKHHWLPPVGSPPVRVCSAFGGLAIYRRHAYLAGTYDGVSDCEHVAFHESIATQTGQGMYLCPSMRCIMQWMQQDGSRRNGDD